MLQVPKQLIDSLLDVKGFNKEAFEKVHASDEQVTSVRLNPAKPIKDPSSTKVPWSEYGFYLDQRPSFTFDPLFHAGCYYVQEASSMFLEEAFRQLVILSDSEGSPLRVLDLCAAPGGKSTHLLSLISKDSLLVSNEIIRSRVNVLNDNIIKWGNSNVAVSSNDPKDFARLENYFDVIVIDAPCSGSGLFRRDPDAINEWSTSNVALCCQRQQRILADALPSLRKGGLLIYSTCSYSKEEDEDISTWLQDELGLEYENLDINSSWQIIDSGMGYRFYPDRLKGEGFFIACFRKPGNEDRHQARSKKSKLSPLSRKEMELIDPWVGQEGPARQGLAGGIEFFKREQTIHAVPASVSGDVLSLAGELKLINSGTIIGELTRDKLVPSHALALSHLANKNIPVAELDLENSIRYLQKKDLVINGGEKGWKLVRYQEHNLGWINVLANRVNNYYPKELRILKG